MILCALACAHADSQRALNHLDRHRLPAAGLDLFPNAGHSGGESVDSRAGCRRGARGTHTAYLSGRGFRNPARRKRERWVLLKIPRGDIDGVGEVK